MQKNLQQLIFITIVLLCENSEVAGLEDPKLLFVQILYRHGDRSPLILYAKDPNPPTVWNEGLGKLTMHGRKQHYDLGKYFRSMYENFITTNPLEINVTSSDVDRCIRSAEANLASFYAPSSQWRFADDLNWQPIPVYYIPKVQDRYLENAYCPQATEESRRIVKSVAGQNFIHEHWKMFENLTAHSGSPITNWTAAGYLYDVIFIEKKYNFTVPSWVLPWWDELQYVYNVAFYWSYSSPLIQRLRAGPLLQQIIENMKLKLSGALPDQKIQIYSAHDITIARVLNALKLFNMRAPPHCSTIIFELYDNSSIRLLFLNSTDVAQKIDPPHILLLDGCQEFCPLEHFENLTSSLIPEDWDRECALEKSFVEKITDHSVGLFILPITLTAVILLVTVCSLWRFHAKGTHEFNK